MERDEVKLNIGCMKSLYSIGIIIGFVFVIFFGLLSFDTRPLSESEIDLARPIFQDSLDLESIRIKYGGPLTAIYPGVTVGNTISFPVGEYDFDDRSDRALLLHELTHAWQYQNNGWSYLVRALYEEVFQADAYTVHYDPSKLFVDYDVEEQCEIVAEHYLSNGEKYSDYIKELQLNAR